MVFANIESTLILKNGYKNAYDILRVKMRMMSSFSEVDGWMYEISLLFTVSKKGNLITEKAKKYEYTMMPFYTTEYMLMFFKKISPLVEDGFIKATYSDESYDKYEVINGEVIYSYENDPEDMMDMRNEITRM